MEPEVTNQPKINKNTFKIGSGDLQQQVANNTKRIAAVSVLLKSNRRGNAKQLTPTVSNLQETLAESNLILADIAIQLQQDFDSQELREQRLLQKSKEDKLELKRTNKEKDIEYQKTEKKITKTTNKVKGPLDAVFGFLKNILLLFGGLVLVKTLLGTQAGKNLINNITSSEKFQQAKATLDIIFDNLKKGLQAVLVIGGVILGMKLISTLATIYAVGKGFIAIMANPIVLAGLGILVAMGMRGLGKGEREVIDELEAMGGYSEENRDKLIKRLQEKKDSIGFLDPFGEKGEIDKRIKFLETGEYKSGRSNEFLDWDNIDDLTSLSDIDKLMMNIDPNWDPTFGMTKDNNNNNISMVDLKGETIDLRQNNKDENIGISEVSATNVEVANSVDINNRYVSEFPITAGFDDSVYV